ncbi:GNAT family N-acetyltransferase [Chitinolyticbacter albus]|uniref:GNAT family N-acetyltransferase n=1 Tax=Chitinolyticbacter albus TaxID=2961951 RepID=UPI00210BAF22|nr:GNAT family N-acetyltransferase [Chitinolyticbacter albus]
MLIRETQLADLPELFRVRAATRENALSVDYLATLGITPESAARSMASGESRGWLCEIDGRIVGFASGDRSSGEMLVLAVLPEYEGRGIGRALLQRVRDWLADCGCPRVWLAANPDPAGRAHGFYRRCGWQPLGEYSNGDEILIYRGEHS